MERLAGLPTIDATTEYRLDDVGFVDFGDGGEGENLPALLTYQVSDEVIFVQSLHYHDDHARGFVIQTGKQRAVEPFIDASALGFRNRFVGFQRIVDDDDIGDRVDGELGHPSQKPSDSLAFVDHWNDHTGISLPARSETYLIGGDLPVGIHGLLGMHKNPL